MFSRVLSALTGENTVDAGDSEDWPYVWQEDAVENIEGQAVISHGTDEWGEETVFAGPLAREMMDAAHADPESPIYVGVGTRRGRHAAIERQYLRRHLAVFGITGYGKSTLLRTLARQVHGNSGMAIFDPKGDDSKELMQVIAPERLDDVVWVEPGNMRSAATGFNFLEVGVDPDHPMYPTLETNVVDDLVQMIGLDDYWGPRMDGIARNLIRATSRMDQSFTLLDLYFIIATEENRQRYAEMVSSEGHRFLSVYAESIAQMNEDDLDAIRRRLQRWVEDPLARQLISHRDSSLDVESVVENGQIMIARMGAASEDLKGMVGTALIRRLWSTIRARAELRQADRDTFYITVDEADLVLKEDSGVLSILSKGRSLGASFTVCCQQPSQLPENIVAGIYGNCDTVLSFSPGSPADSRAVAKNLDMDEQTLRRESNYHIWMQVTLSDTRERSDAFRVYTFPPPPAVRSETEAIHAIERIVRRDGRPHQSDAEQLDDLVINSGDGTAEQLGMSVDEGEENARLDVTDRVIEATVAAIYGVSIRQGNTGGAVETEAAVDAIRRSLARLEETPDRETIHDLLTDADSLHRRVLQYIPEDTLEQTGSTVRPKTPRKTLAVIGESPSDGGRVHAQIMWDAWEGLAWAGVDMLILDSGGDDPDGVAWPAPNQNNPELVKKLVGQDPDDEARIESEKATTTTKGGYTVQHVLQAAQEGRRAIALCRPSAVETTADKLLREPQYARSDHNREGETRYYNVGDLKITHNGERTVMKRPGSGENVWVREHASGDVVLRDDSGTVHSRFEDPRMAFTDAHAYPGGDRTVTRPVIPETFDMDTEPHAEILSVPEGADGLGELELVVDPDGMTITAEAVGRGENDEHVPAVDPVDLDISRNAQDLLRFIRENPAVEEPFTKRQIHNLAAEHGPDNLDRSRQAVNRWVNDLGEEGALEDIGRGETGAVEWRAV